MANKAAKTASVDIINDGDRPITVVQTAAGCGCFRLNMPDDPRIPPRGRRSLSIVLDCESLRPGGHKYPLEAFISDRPTTPISGSVEYAFSPDVDLSRPEFTLISTPATGDRADRIQVADTIRVTDSWTNHLDVISGSTSSSLLRYELKPIVDDKLRGYDVTVIATARFPAGQVKEALTLFTNHPAYRELVIPIRGEIASEVTAEPSTIILGRLHPGESFSRTVILKCSAPFIVNRVTTSDAKVVAEPLLLPTTPAGNETRRELRISGKAPETLLSAIDVVVALEYSLPRPFLQHIHVRGVVDSATGTSSALTQINGEVNE